MGKKNKAKSADKPADKPAAETVANSDAAADTAAVTTAATDTPTTPTTPSTTNGIEAEEVLKETEETNEEAKAEAVPGDLTTQAEEPAVAATEEAVAEAEATAEAEPETKPEPESEVTTESKTEPEAETELKTEPETKAETKAEAPAEPEATPTDEPISGDMSAETVEPQTNGNAKTDAATPSINVTDAGEATQEDAPAETPAKPASDASAAASASSTRPSRAHSIAHSVTSTTSTSRSSMASSVFIKNSLNTISTSKEAKKNAALSTAVGKALSTLDRDENPSAQTIFEPMRLVCQGNDAELQVVALDAIGKMFTYSFFEDPAPLPHNEEAGIVPPPRIPLIEQAITCVCEAHRGDATDQRVELQIVKALMAAVLNEEHIAHGATLLKAIRQSYNIFVTSPYQANQIVAQASISQMVNVVFERVKVNLKKKAISSSAVDSNEYVESTADILGSSNGSSSDIKLNLSDLNRADVDDEDRVMEAKTSAGQDKSDIVAKDAFLVFRAMSKLSIKDIESDSVDIRSKEMRSKLLSLHLVHSILKSHMTVFLSKDVVIKSSGAAKNTTFVNAVRQYICLTLAKNASSITPAVFELSAEIFWLLLSNLRGQFKKEIDVVLTEVYFHIVEMKTSTAHQKLYFLGIISRLCNDPRALVEVFLNYDCTRGVGNIYETLINYLVRHATARIVMTPVQMQQYREWKHKPIAVYNTSLPPQLASANLTSTSYTPEVLPYPVEYALRMTSLECIVAVLRSLHSWSHKGMTAAGGASISIAASDSTTPTGGRHSSVSSLSSIQPNDFVDDPTQFEDLKLQKNNLEGGIRMFNQSPKRGMAALIKSGFVASNTPEDIAKFLIETDGLDKAKIGDYLGGHEKEHVEIMYAFVDYHDFTGMRYVDALRIFLQSFRLPGEAQKIDRFLLKFAQRYISGNPDSAFVNAESAYVLAYSVVMLNVDQHSTKVKNRMKPENFVSNNRGINEGGDLPPELLLEIFEEIQKNEIKLDSEQADAAISNAFEAAEQPTGIAASLGFGKDVNKEAYLKAAREMTSKTEQLFRGSSSTNDEPGLYYVASHFEHVRPMFDSVWMSVVAALSGPLHTSDDEETVKLCLDGIKYSIKISCLFDIELPRESFVNTLAKFTSLSQLHEMRQKNIAAIRVLLDVAVSDGAGLKRGWKDILTCVSQLERCQLIVGGVSATAIPDINDARIHGRASLDRRRAVPPNGVNTFTPEVEAALKSESLNKLTDKIFVQSASLPVDACVDFVRALAEVSWQEIKSSAGNDNPRTFSLQKMVDVSYYNMGRIKMEWTPIWAVMGAQFNKVGTIPNTMIVFMALDSLRQLAGRFLDLEELSHFKFQKDFLQPFEYIMEKNSSGEVKDMVLQCIRQLLLSKKSAFRSGWISVFNVCGAATSSSSKSLLNTAFDIVKKAREQLLTEVILQDAFVPMTKCLTAIAMNQLSQKTALHAIEQLKAIIVDVSNDKTEENGVPHPQQLPRLWMPVFQSFHDIIMTGEDLEVRSRALNYLFDVLVQYGGGFEADAWDTICTEVLFPIFVILKSRSEMARFNNQDDVSVWLSTTMIQALRNMIALFTHYFSTLDRMLDGFLDLLVTCINQENDTVSRIGSTCLQQLITENVGNFNDQHWAKIVDTFGELFKTNTAVELFESTRKPDDPEDKPQRTDKQKIFKTIIVKCILQLLAIDTVEGLFQDEQVYQSIPTKQLLRITNMLQESYTFSKTFNADKDLRMRLWKEGFMKQYPNLFRQESHSVSTYLHLTFKVYLDPVKTTPEQHDAIGKQLLPLALELMEMYAALDFDQNKEKVISTWTPVIVSVLQNYARFPDSEFNANAEDFFKLSLNLLEKDVSLEVRVAVKHILHRVGQLYMKGKGKE